MRLASAQTEKNDRLNRRIHGFSLIEALVSCTVFILILAVVTSMMNSTSSMWLRHRNQSAAFEAANAAFSALTRSLAQAVLNTYWAVQDGRYGRASELHFVMEPTVDLVTSGSSEEYPGQSVFFQAALGRATDTGLRRLPYLLNGLGYFVRFDGGPAAPFFITPRPRYRYRLYEWLQPTENLRVYDPATTTAEQRKWFSTDFASPSSANTAVLAENVLGLIFMAEYPVANGSVVPAFEYDSRETATPATLHQLPPRIRVLMAVIDEASAIRLAEKYGAEPPPVHPDEAWFQTPADFDSDLTKWEDRLKAIEPRIEYRFFTATVIVQNAKWSL